MTVQTTIAERQRRMSAVGEPDWRPASGCASRSAPRIRSAGCRLGKVVAEAGHVVVGPQDAADVVLVDGDSPPGETRPVVTPRRRR